MKIVQIIKRVNNTELGKGTTHETYILVPNDLDISDIFPQAGVEYIFFDKYSGKKYTLRNTVGRESRIVTLKQYYKDTNLCAGDELVLERQIKKDISTWLIYTKKHADNLVLQKSRYGYEILTPDRKTSFLTAAKAIGVNISIEFSQSRKKRSDSPYETNFYDVNLPGINLADFGGNKEGIELTIRNGRINVSGFFGWKKYVYEQGG